MSTLDRIPRIERLATLVGLLALLVLAIGPVVGLVLMLRESFDPIRMTTGRQHVAEGIVVICTSIVVGATMLLNVWYVEHRLILDRRAAERD